MYYNVFHQNLEVENCMSVEIANYMTWHDEECPNDGNLWHLTNGLSCKEIDSLYLDFAKESRIERFALITGINFIPNLKVRVNNFLNP